MFMASEFSMESKLRPDERARVRQFFEQFLRVSNHHYLSHSLKSQQIIVFPLLICTSPQQILVLPGSKLGPGATETNRLLLFPRLSRTPLAGSGPARTSAEAQMAGQGACQ